VVFLSTVELSVSQTPACHFAVNYDSNGIYNSNDVRDRFLRDVFYWEANFHTPGVGYDGPTGLTFDGHGIDYVTGLLADPQHYWSAPSKESIHLMLLAQAIEGNPYAQIFVSPENASQAVEVAMQLLTNKMNSYEAWNAKYPGFGGYIPWIYIQPSGVTPANGWSNSVPSLDNGEWIWGLYAVINVLTGYDLAARYQNYFDMLAANAYMMFYNGNGQIRAEAKILNVTAQPSPGNYQNNSPGYYLDDPYEGEMFAFFLDLFGKWPDPNEREKVWVYKRAKLQAVNYTTPEGPITVQRGWWFSAHEQWKYLELPYMDIPINKRVFLNGERARTWNSNLNNIPGLYASVSNVTTGGPVTQYISGCGIQQIAFETVQTTVLITPYGSFPVILADYPTGLVWYYNMLMGSRMQGPYGSTESVSTSGDAISPVLTWDSKITTLCAMVGGISNIVREQLLLDNVYLRFYQVVNREWNLAFPSLSGENLSYKLPLSVVPNPLGVFTTCTAK